ncbi:MAG: hypothetical protein ACKPKO_02125, partial [Candidatus Fonsibacter sp.]
VTLVATGKARGVWQNAVLKCFWALPYTHIVRFSQHLAMHNDFATPLVRVRGVLERILPELAVDRILMLLEPRGRALDAHEFCAAP